MADDAAEYAARSAEEFKAALRCVHGAARPQDCDRGCTLRFAAGAAAASTPRVTGASAAPWRAGG